METKWDEKFHEDWDKADMIAFRLNELGVLKEGIMSDAIARQIRSWLFKVENIGKKK